MPSEPSYENLKTFFAGVFGEIETVRNEDGTYTRTFSASVAQLAMTLSLDTENVRRALDQAARAFEPLVAFAVLSERHQKALRCPPAPKRRRRYAAQGRRRRNEMLRQKAAYQRRQAARADDAVG